MKITDFKKFKNRNEKIACLTAYDASIAKFIENCGIDLILVGDSLGMVIKGFDNTRSVELSDMIYHTKAVTKVCNNALVVVDMPYKSYDNQEDAILNAKKIMSAGAQMVKLEGGLEIENIIKSLVANKIPVFAHLGLQPQKFTQPEDYRIQGRDKKSAAEILKEAILVESLGVDALILECIPQSLAKEITKKLTIPTIGIGAGRYCDGQILVCFDMLGITKIKMPKFVRNFVKNGKDISYAIKDYISCVKNMSFPNDDESY